MPTLTHADIVRLRTEFNQAERLFYAHAELAAKREECENLIKMLQLEVEQDPFRTHQATGAFQEEMQPHSLLLSPHKQQLLDDLKRRLHELDLLLDESEDLTEEHILAQQENLLTCIWKVHPVYRSEWEKKWKDYRFHLYLEDRLNRLKDFIKELSSRLDYAIQQRRRIRGKGLLNYIFGTSPNAVIERHLLCCHQAIQRFLPTFHKFILEIKGTTDEAFWQDLFQFLEKLKEHCRTPWSFRSLDTVFTEAHQKLTAFHQKISQDLKQIRFKHKELKQQLSDWIQQI